MGARRRRHHCRGAAVRSRPLEAVDRARRAAFGDRDVSLGEPVTESALNGAWGVRIYVKPFVDWIWFGCLLMAVGGFLAVSDRRYRLTVKERFAAAVRAVSAA